MRRVQSLLLVLLASCTAPVGPVVEEDPAIDGDEGESEIPEGEGDGTGEEPEDEQTPPDGAKPVMLAPGCTARATVGGFTTWFHFVRPDDPCNGTAGSGIDFNAIAELNRLIASAPAGSRIDGHIFNMTIDSVGKALLDAQTRGVDVRISTDGQLAASTDTVKTQYLDKLNGIVYCASSTTNSCVSSAENGISHTKLFVFSRATAPDAAVSDNVVWFGSANQTLSSGTKSFNNTVTIYGDGPLYTMMRDYLDDLRLRRRAADYYDPSSGRGHLLAASADVYVSPEATTDLVVNRLDDVTPDGKCRMRVQQASIRDSRMDVVNRIIAMKRGGCDVQIVANTIEPQALAALEGANIPLRETHVHDKVFIVYGKYGTAYQYRVYTGSHNLSISANRKYDEIFVKLAPETEASHPVYDEYMAHFSDAYNVATAR